MRSIMARLRRERTWTAPVRYWPPSALLPGTLARGGGERVVRASPPPEGTFVGWIALAPGEWGPHPVGPVREGDQDEARRDLKAWGDPGGFVAGLWTAAP